jgi:hypothetical protein
VCTDKVGLCSGCDSDTTDLRCHFQHRYPIATTARHRWLSLAKIFVARIIASCRRRVDIMLTFIATVAIWNYNFFFIKITRQHELKTIVATQQLYCSSHRSRTRSINPPLLLIFLSLCWFDISFLLGQSDTIYF